MSTYAPLTCESLPARLGGNPAMLDRIGGADSWQVVEVGDGNLNLVFIVTGALGSIVVKQALPYVRVVGESWPMSRERATFEHHALIRLGARDPGRLPAMHHFDPDQSMQIMEHVSPHVILRRELIAGKTFAVLGDQLGRYLARTLFRGSELSLPTAARKADLALFAGNVELSGITEDLVFTDWFWACSRNRHTALLDDTVAAVRADLDLKLAALELKSRFCSLGQTLLHGDLHTGSIMVAPGDTRVIDAEFAVYGPIGFDIGLLLGNLWMACIAQPAHRGDPDEARAYGRWILDTSATVWTVFVAEFSTLWRTERTGILSGRELFEDRGDAAGSEAALRKVLQDIWQDTLGYAGIEMHRRILGFAHVAEFESIADEATRADRERRALAAGRALAVQRHEFLTIDQVNDWIAHCL